MWIAKFTLQDDDDIYTPLCVKRKVEFFATPYSHYTKEKKINLLVGGILSGKNTAQFLKDLRKDKRIKAIETHHDYVFIHAQHPISRELTAEINIFYNPQYIRVKPVHVSSDGLEYWEVACLDRDELNKLIQAAQKYYHGKLISLKKEKLKAVSNLEITPHLSQKQFEDLELAYKEGYYNYPRNVTLPTLAKQAQKAYSSFQENVRKAENKLIEYFLKYR